MTKVRENLVDRMIRIYGFENPIVIEFCRLCESKNTTDRALELLVNCHERYPQTEEKEI